MDLMRMLRKLVNNLTGGKVDEVTGKMNEYRQFSEGMKDEKKFQEALSEGDYEKAAEFHEMREEEIKNIMSDIPMMGNFSEVLENKEKFKERLPDDKKEELDDELSDNK